MFVPQEHLRAGVVAFMLKTAPSLHEEHLEWEFFFGEASRSGSLSSSSPELELLLFHLLEERPIVIAGRAAAVKPGCD